MPGYVLCLLGHTTRTRFGGSPHQRPGSCLLVCDCGLSLPSDYRLSQGQSRPVGIQRARMCDAACLHFVPKSLRTCVYVAGVTQTALQELQLCDRQPSLTARKLHDCLSCRTSHTQAAPTLAGWRLTWLNRRACCHCCHCQMLQHMQQACFTCRG